MKKLFASSIKIVLSYLKFCHQYAIQITSICNKSFFSFLKKLSLKTKEIIGIDFLITVLIKMRLLIFLVLSQYGLACKCRIISEIYNWMQILHFLVFLALHFHNVKIQLQLIVYLILLRQVRWFVTWWIESSIINSENREHHQGNKQSRKTKDGSRWNIEPFQN